MISPSTSPNKVTKRPFLPTEQADAPTNPSAHSTEQSFAHHEEQGGTFCSAFTVLWVPRQNEVSGVSGGNRRKSHVTFSDGLTQEVKERQKKKQVEELEFDVCLSLSDCKFWKVNFCSRVARGSNRPIHAMPWISEMEKSEDNATILHATLNYKRCHRRFREVGLDNSRWVGEPFTEKIKALIEYCAGLRVKRQR